MSTIPSLTLAANKQTALAERHRGTYEQAATAAGVALCAIQAQLPRGEWMRWVKEQYDYSQKTANTYMYFARGPVGRGGTSAYPTAFRRQAKALRRNGWAYAEIAQELNVPRSTIGNWLNPAPQRRLDERASVLRREATALRQRQVEEASQRRARAAGGNVLKARTSLLAAYEALDALAQRATDADLCLEYTKAKGCVSQATLALDRASAERLLVR